jgi:hypothetical protein
MNIIWKHTLHLSKAVTTAREVTINMDLNIKGTEIYQPHIQVINLSFTRNLTITNVL